MKSLTEDVIHFFQNQGCVIVSTIGSDGFVHNACKGIVRVDSKGQVYLLDLYRSKTLENLRNNKNISITAIDEHKFIGYCLKGQANLLAVNEVEPELIKVWEDRVTGRLVRRLLKNIREEKGHPHHPEALLPKPEYMIVMKIKEVVDLTPRHLQVVR